MSNNDFTESEVPSVEGVEDKAEASPEAGKGAAKQNKAKLLLELALLYFWLQLALLVI
jgi:hypothetical protein